MRHLISQNIVSRDFFVGTLAAIFGAVSFAVPLPALSQNPSKIFSDDFESGNFSKWTDCHDKITTSQVHSGTRALQYDGWPGCVGFFSQPSREVYLKFWWYLPPGFASTFLPGAHFYRITYGNLGHFQLEQVDTFAGNGKLSMHFNLGPGGPVYYDTAIMPTGRWFKHETYIKQNDPGVANGVAKIWVDGVPQLEKTNVNLGATSNNLNILELTTNYNCSGVCYWYMDDVEVWNGCPSGSSCNGAPPSLPPPGNLRVVSPP